MLCNQIFRGLNIYTEETEHQPVTIDHTTITNGMDYKTEERNGKGERRKANTNRARWTVRRQFRDCNSHLDIDEVRQLKTERMTKEGKELECSE
jgi:hypothetical protein